MTRRRQGSKMDWFWAFPHLDDESLRLMRVTIDNAFRTFTRAWGDPIQQVFEPLRLLLIVAEWVMLNTPWMVVILAIALLGWLASRSWAITIGSVITLLLIGYFDMWEDTMRTISMIFVCTLISLTFGIPVGIVMARSNRVRNVISPILDVMQTMPSFVYLIPVVMLLGIGRVPGLLAVVIYAIPPIIRLTDLGIRLVNKEVLEASDAFGSSNWQKLVNVQIPLAMPTIMTGINQTIM
ncbi:MAG TPA: ABC transporter permease subunit, partial [Anaerolineales bacterium]